VGTTAAGVKFCSLRNLAGYSPFVQKSGGLFALVCKSLAVKSSPGCPHYPPLLALNMVAKCSAGYLLEKCSLPQLRHKA
jgi:hypothetical protein